VYTLTNFRTAFIAVLFSLTLFFPSSLSASSGFIFEGDQLVTDATLKKIKEIGDELYEKTGITTVLVTKKHLDKEEFLEIKDRYLKELKAPYVLWIFSTR
jgi:hypothetical protein